jgi:hypothetical protein
MMLVVKTIHDFEMSMFAIPQSAYYHALFSDKLSSIKTIDRVWRKMQEEHPHLRGEDWEERQILAGRVSRDISAGMPTLF